MANNKSQNLLGCYYKDNTTFTVVLLKKQNKRQAGGEAGDFIFPLQSPKTTRGARKPGETHAKPGRTGLESRVSAQLTFLCSDRGARWC